MAKSEDLKNGSNDGNDGTDNGSGGGGVNGSSVRTLGNGNGESVGSGGSDIGSGGSDIGSGGSDGPGGIVGDGNGLGRSGGSGAAPGGSGSEVRAVGGSDPIARRGRGRPRKLGGNGSDRVTGTGSGRTDAGSRQVEVLGSDDLGKGGEPKAVDEKIFDEPDLSKLTKSEIESVVASVLQGVFYAIGSGLKHPHWELTNKESAELSAALWDCVKTLPAKQSKRVNKFLKEYAPWIKLLMVGGTILGSRAAVSLELEKVKRENEQLRQFNRSNAGPISADAGSVLTDEFIQ